MAIREDHAAVASFLQCAQILARGLYLRASTAELDPRAKPRALTRDVNTPLSTAEADPQTKLGAPTAAPAAVESG